MERAKTTIGFKYDLVEKRLVRARAQDSQENEPGSEGPRRPSGGNETGLPELAEGEREDIEAPEAGSQKARER